MKTLPGELRSRFAAVIKQARRAGEEGARKALGILAVGDARAHQSMSAAEQDLRRRLRAHGRQLGDRRDPETGRQAIDRLAHEVAYEHWHRMLFARFLAENDLLIEPESEASVSLADCEELAREQGQDSWTLAGRFAERMLPQIFRSDDPALEVRFAPESRQKLDRLLESLPPAVFTARDSLGWTYQFWQAEQKDAVNASGVKIGAEELPAVTQLFTERYMVLFLLHNTVGAWHAGRILAAHPDLAADAAGERELREAVRLASDGGYDFEYLRFVREPREGDDAGRPTGSWRPAAGPFSGWPRTAAVLRVLDPCCGSGHFLVETLDLLARLRMVEEQLARDQAVEAVLRDNLFGLEIDPRCTQIAAFNLALAAWTWPGAGGWRRLPELNLACSGLAPGAARDDWLALGEAAADAGGLPAKRDLLGTEDTLLSGPLRNTLGALHDLFAQAPVLGSLIDPWAVEADLYQPDYESVRALLGSLLEQESCSDEQTERAVAAQGMARAAELLAGRYHLVITNVPYLARGKQVDALKQFAQDRHPAAKADLATLFVSRAFGWLDRHGAQAVVTPQNWLFLTRYKKLRETLLKQRTWSLVARLGEHAFDDSQAAGAFAAMVVLSTDSPRPDWRMAGIDVSAPRGQRPIRAEEKAALLRGRASSSDTKLSAVVNLVRRADLLKAPKHIIQLDTPTTAAILGTCAFVRGGTTTGDSPRFRRLYWEIDPTNPDWLFQQCTVKGTLFFGGREQCLLWKTSEGEEVADLMYGPGATVAGREAWRRRGVAISYTGNCYATLYMGSVFENVICVAVPRKAEHLAALWAFCESPRFMSAVRRNNQKLSVDVRYFETAEFDASHWLSVASEKYPNGLPEPHSDDPTQWIFHGHPYGSVVWDEGTKRTAHGARRIDATVLHVAVARLLGYRWPAEQDPDMRLAEEMRTWVDRCRSLAEFADADGIVCLAPGSGESAAADRLRLLLAAAYGDDWSVATERQLLTAARPDGPAESLEEWLRDRFFEEHCRLFRQRPFIWHLWDGRRDGFHALVNYHHLAGPHGGARRTLEALTYRHLGDWIARRQADRDQGVEGADGRLAAAQDLQQQLEKITVGEPPCDLFVRWKPLAEQPVGWEPDVNDGVRVNIRPFMAAELRHGGRAGAGLLRVKPKIAWNKDRGKEALKPRKRWKPPWLEDGDDADAEVDEDLERRPREQYPWFWGCPGDGTRSERTDFPGGPDFDGNRWNDLHYTNAAKRIAREPAGATSGDGKATLRLPAFRATPESERS